MKRAYVEVPKKMVEVMFGAPGNVFISDIKKATMVGAFIFYLEGSGLPTSCEIADGDPSTALDYNALPHIAKLENLVIKAQALRKAIDVCLSFGSKPSKSKATGDKPEEEMIELI